MPMATLVALLIAGAIDIVLLVAYAALNILARGLSSMGNQSLEAHAL